MNFFGHATVACWFDQDPHFVFGAMLPDLAAMLGVRPPTSALPAVSRGITLHHATDAAFHGTPSFLALLRLAREALLALDLGRGPARALAHIGTEILLDESLGKEPGVESAYLSALGAAATAAAEFKGPADGARLLALTQSLYDRGVVRSHPPALVARRLQRALQAHPRLAFAPADEARVAEWVLAFRPEVAAAANTVVDELGQRLRGALGDSAHPEFRLLP